MNNQGQITESWGDGRYDFRLTVNGIIELEQKCDAPFAVIFGRLNGGTFKLNDIRETIRLGLVGGGVASSKALTLVENYIMPLSESLPLARAIVGGVMFGFEASPLGNPEAAPEASTNVSTPPPSTEQHSSLESVLNDWDKSAFGNFSPA